MCCFEETEASGWKAGDGVRQEELQAKTTRIQDFWLRPDANFLQFPPLKNKHKISEFQMRQGVNSFLM